MRSLSGFNVRVFGHAGKIDPSLSRPYQGVLVDENECLS